MGQTKYNKAIEVLKNFVEKEKRNYIYTNDLRNLIQREIAGTENIILSTLKMLRELGVITETKEHRWEIKII